MVLEGVPGTQQQCAHAVEAAGLQLGVVWSTVLSLCSIRARAGWDPLVFGTGAYGSSHRQKAKYVQFGTKVWAA
jgi:hypothetical protein